EESVVFDLAEVFGAEQFLRADDLRAALGGALNERHLPLEVCIRIVAARHLRQAHVDDPAV
ncbi:MAG TPA: hypothetical protein VLJ39_17470, partial [Tepidisphaeraceae bacterium]|nr:hypothetical protein [Tepidisphaeraceae bacterium]